MTLDRMVETLRLLGPVGVENRSLEDCFHKKIDNGMTILYKYDPMDILLTIFMGLIIGCIFDN